MHIMIALLIFQDIKAKAPFFSEKGKKGRNRVKNTEKWQKCTIRYKKQGKMLPFVKRTLSYMMLSHA